MASTHLAVLGSPIEHSKSPAIHAAAYDALGLDWDYGRYRIEANELDSFLKLRDASWRGLSLTMPLKEVGFQVSIPSCPVAEATGVVNTLVHTEAGWEGYNTDAYGIMQALRNAGLEKPTQVSILGAGATATSAVYAVKHLNAEVKVRVFARRSVEVMGIASEPLEDFYRETATGLVISTLPGSVEHKPFEVAAGSMVFDVAYDPWPSKFAAHWANDARISGFEMLLWQALGQIRLFVTGDGRHQFDNEAKLLEVMRNSVKF